MSFALIVVTLHGCFDGSLLTFCQIAVFKVDKEVTFTPTASHRKHLQERITGQRLGSFAFPSAAAY